MTAMAAPARLPWLRAALVATAAAAVLLGSSASAAAPAPSLTYQDPAGDSASVTGSADILAVSYSTSGTGKGKAYVAKNLVVTMTLGAPPTSDGTTLYEVEATLPGCGSFSMSYIPGARLGGVNGFAQCGSEPDETGSTGTLFGFSAVVSGKTLTYRLPFKDLPGKLRVGDELYLLNAKTDLVEPVFGLIGPGTIGLPLYDTAKTSKFYTVG